MNLYLISQKQNHGYDTYSSAVVVAPNAFAAAHIHPSGKWEDDDDTWMKPAFVDAKYLGVAEADIPEGVICASFHAG